MPSRFKGTGRLLFTKGALGQLPWLWDIGLLWREVVEQRSLPEQIVKQRVILKKHDLETALLMFKSIDSDRQRLGEFLPWVPFIKTVEDEISYIKSTHDNWQDGSQFGYSIFQSETEDYVGNVGVHNISWQNHRCEIGYWILGKYEGQGLMSAAVEALEQACFASGFNRIEIRCSSLNLKSAKVPKRLGYTLEGTLRREAFENGKYRDTLVFAKIQNEK